MKWQKALWLLMACSCAASPSHEAKHWFADVDDYELYRQTQGAPTLEARLSASWLYLRRYPNGAFREQVRDWFKPVERDYWLHAWKSRKRLAAYLQALPDGPHAEPARARMRALDLGRASELKLERDALERARRVDAKLEAAERSREEFLASVKNWVGRLASITDFGVRTHELGHDFIQAYRVDAPAAVCGETICEKALTFGYTIPIERKLSERVAVFDVVIVLFDGGVQRLELIGPDLFSRIGEALLRAPVGSDDPRARVEAIGTSQLFFGSVLEPRFPASDCARDAVSPVILERTCHGVLVRAIAAVDGSGDDRLVIEPLPKATVSPGTG